MTKKPMHLIAGLTALLMSTLTLHATEWHFNVAGIAYFKAKPNESGISDLVPVGNISSVDYVTVGQYTVSYVNSLDSMEVYQVVFTAPPGYSPGIMFQNESYCSIGLKLNGEWVDSEGLTVSIHRLTEASQ